MPDNIATRPILIPEGILLVISVEIDKHSGFCARWLARVQQLYKEKQMLARARAKGYILKKRSVVQTSTGREIRLSLTDGKYVPMDRAPKARQSHKGSFSG